MTATEPRTSLVSAAPDVDRLRTMLTIRKLEEQILNLRREEKIAGSVHVCVGQESAPVGVMASLDERDRVVATYRGHGWAVACGVPPEAILAEALGRSSGTNGGRGGSPYLSSPRHRFIGENSIVGAGLPIANGIAMGLVARGAGGICVVSFGDGATNQGAAHEAFVFAIARGLPVVFVCENNGWSEMTPITTTVPNAELHLRARGYGMESAVVDGSDVEGVRVAASLAIQHARSGGGPYFLEIRVPRILGHYNADAELYRGDDDREAHRARDPIAAAATALKDRGLVDDDTLRALEDETAHEISAAAASALASPPADPETAREHVTTAPAQRSADPLPDSGDELAYGLAANRALALELEARDDLILFGEDIAIPGGTFGVTRNLRKRFGERVFDTPISEAAILGAAVGASQSGLRPVVEIMWTDFLFVAFDQVVNQASNVRYLSRGEVSAPLVVRMQQGVTPGSCAQHSQSMEAVLAHVPGIKVGMPSTPHDAYAMLRAAIADPDPVFIIEARSLYQTKGLVNLDGPTEPVGGARLRREGRDVLIVTWGAMTTTVLEAAQMLALQGVDAAVLDMRWLAPLDESALVTALENAGGKAVIVHEANLTGGFGAEIAARLAERHFDSLDGPVVRIGLPDVRVPSAPTLQAALVPSAATIVDAAARLALS